MTIQLCRGAGWLAELWFIRVWPWQIIMVVILSSGCVGSQKRMHIFVPLNSTLRSGNTFPVYLFSAMFLFSAEIFDQVLQASWSQLGFLVVIEIVPFFDFVEVDISQFGFHYGGDFEEKVELFDEIFTVAILISIFVVENNIVESSVNWMRH